jgi:hypothetical protein
MELIPVYGLILAIITALFSAVKWILSVKIAPLQEKNESLEEKNKALEGEIDDLKKLVVDEVRQISLANFEFRREYEAGISDIKLLLAEKYVLKEDYNREVTEIHKRINISHDIKAIKETLKQLNS